MHLLFSSSVHRRNLELTCGSLSRLGGLATKVQQLAPFSGSPRTQRSPSASDGKLGGVWEQVYCSHEFVLLIAVTKQRDPDSGQHSLFFQVSRELNNGGTFSLNDTRLHLQPHSQTDFVVWVLDNPETLNSLIPRPFLLQTASL